MATDKINKALPLKYRKKIVKELRESLMLFDKENDSITVNWKKYFLNVSDYGLQKGKTPEGIEAIGDLYPPNFEILDYFLKNKITDKVLDFGCGAGVMIVYLDKIGVKIYGYDDWSQLAAESTIHFLTRYGLQDRLLGKDEIEDFQYVYHSGIPCDPKQFKNLIKMFRDPNYN